MRIRSSCRGIVAASIAGFTYLGLSLIDVAPAAAEDARTCFNRESDKFFTNLAIAISERTINPAAIGDDFIAKGTDSIVGACRSAAPPIGAADATALREYMAKWTVHLDRKLTDLERTGRPD